MRVECVFVSVAKILILRIEVTVTVLLYLCIRPADSADRPDQDFRLAGGGEAAAALGPLRVPPSSRRHRG